MDVTQLLAGVQALEWGQVVMMVVGGVLIYLAIAKEYEPVLLLPIGVGCLLANLPLSALVGEEGLLTLLYRVGVSNELFPLLIFPGRGCDDGLSTPVGPARLCAAGGSRAVRDLWHAHVGGSSGL